MMEDPYFNFCDKLARQFFDGSLKVDQGLAKRVDLDFLPEPYLPFSQSGNWGVTESSNFLNVLLANPGQGLDVQRHESISSGRISGVSDGISYSAAASKIARFYETYFQTNRKYTPALRRFRKMHNLAIDAGYSAVLQLDTIPWHSYSLPAKISLPPLISKCDMTKKYCFLLREYLRDRSVISVDGAGSRHAISKETFHTPWMTFKADLMGLEIDTADFHPIIEKPGKITAAAIRHKHNGTIKVMYCVQGNNNLPSEISLSKLSKLLRHSNTWMMQQ